MPSIEFQHFYDLLPKNQISERFVIKFTEVVQWWTKHIARRDRAVRKLIIELANNDRRRAAQFRWANVHEISDCKSKVAIDSREKNLQFLSISLSHTFHIPFINYISLLSGQSTSTSLMFTSYFSLLYCRYNDSLDRFNEFFFWSFSRGNCVRQQQKKFLNLRAIKVKRVKCVCWVRRLIVCWLAHVIMGFFFYYRLHWRPETTMSSTLPPIHVGISTDSREINSIGQIICQPSLP